MCALKSFAAKLGSVSGLMLAKMVREKIEVDHPLSAEKALRGFEVVMAVYESARLHKRIRLPLEQEKFPLELMMAV